MCEKHHWECEKTTLTIEQVREAAKFVSFVIPNSLSEGVTDEDRKIENGFRKAGTLFNDDGVQKIFKQQGMLYMFYQA